jgi:hypothetical protein
MQTTEQRLERLTDQNVYTRCNGLGQLLVGHFDGDDWINIGETEMGRIHMPTPELNEDGDPYEYFEPMQYFMISEWLAERMLKHGLTRDAVIEMNDGTYIWVRCGCGYALSDDLQKYFEN